MLEDMKYLQDTRYPIGLLDPRVGYCVALTSLLISTVSEYREFYENPKGGLLYASWARFIASVRHKLQVLAFDQGININWFNEPKGNCCPQPRRIHRPVDRLFVKYILPVLLEEPWPRMKSIQIRGVGRDAEA